MDVCAICTEDMAIDGVEDYGQLDSCKHRFHYECVVQWAKINASCPQCRGSFGIIEHILLNEFGMTCTKARVHRTGAKWEVVEERVEPLQFDDDGAFLQAVDEELVVLPEANRRKVPKRKSARRDRARTESKIYVDTREQKVEAIPSDAIDPDFQAILNNDPELAAWVGGGDQRSVRAHRAVSASRQRQTRDESSPILPRTRRPTRSAAVRAARCVSGSSDEEDQVSDEFESPAAPKRNHYRSGKATRSASTESKCAPTSGVQSDTGDAAVLTVDGTGRGKAVWVRDRVTNKWAKARKTKNTAAILEEVERSLSSVSSSSSRSCSVGGLSEAGQPSLLPDTEETREDDASNSSSLLHQSFASEWERVDSLFRAFPAISALPAPPTLSVTNSSAEPSTIAPSTATARTRRAAPKEQPKEKRKTVLDVLRPLQAAEQMVALPSSAVSDKGIDGIISHEGESVVVSDDENVATSSLWDRLQSRLGDKAGVTGSTSVQATTTRAKQSTRSRKVR